MMTPKETILRMMHGELPEELPRMGFLPVKCSAFIDIKQPGYHKDEFGVEYIGKEGIFGGTPIPYPGRFLLDDIRRWRDVIKMPDLSGIDWEACAKKDLEQIDRSQLGISFYHGKFFQRVCDFMGFTEGLCAFAEEPEEVYALLDALCAYNEEILKHILLHYRPDSVCIPDDTATARAPFISPATYRELVKPFHKRIADLARDGGALVEMHDCGRCEAFIDDWMDLGVCAWNPAQPSNDLKAIKQKYGRRLIIAGGWDSSTTAKLPPDDDQALLDALTDYVDTLAPDGGFIFSVMLEGDPKDPAFARRQKLVGDFYNDYARPWYRNHS